GVALLAPGTPERFARWLARVQNDLLDVGADLSVPPAPDGAGGGDAPPRARLRVDPSYTEWIEQACDEVNAELEPLRSFVIPRGPVARVFAGGVGLLPARACARHASATRPAAAAKASVAPPRAARRWRASSTAPPSSSRRARRSACATRGSTARRPRAARKPHP